MRRCAALSYYWALPAASCLVSTANLRFAGLCWRLLLFSYRKEIGMHIEQLARRLDRVETSAIRELFKLLGKPGIISFAGGFPDSALFDVEGIRAASEQVLQNDSAAALQYGATEGYQPLREQLASFMHSKGVQGLQPEQLIVTTGSQQALDLLGKTLIDPGDKVIVEGPTFLATIQCFRLYGAELISAPIDGDGVQTDRLEQLMAEHRP